MMPIFKATNHTNYFREAVNLLAQVYTLAPSKVGQLLWSCCINNHGRKGCSIPCDLKQEHLNRHLKVMLRGLGSNITSNAIIRAGKCFATIDTVAMCQL